MGEGKRDHRYFPNFVIVKKTGEFYIIEVKTENERSDKIVKAATGAHNVYSCIKAVRDSKREVRRDH